MVININDAPSLNRFKPFVDYLFLSALEVRGRNIVGVLLIGMGLDGAKGMLKLWQSGVFMIVQDEVISVVYGMPRAVVLLGAVVQSGALNRIPDLMFKGLMRLKAGGSLKDQVDYVEKGKAL